MIRAILEPRIFLPYQTSMLSFLFFLSLIANFVLVYLLYTERSSRLGGNARAEIEASILRQAMQARGRTSAVEIAARFALPLLQVENVLREMVSHNQCQSELDREGRAIYVFPQFDDSTKQGEATEREILLMAHLHGGELTAQQIAMRTTMSFDESQQWLMEMSERGACAPVDEHNDRFRFKGLRH